MLYFAVLTVIGVVNSIPALMWIGGIGTLVTGMIFSFCVGRMYEMKFG